MDQLGRLERMLTENQEAFCQALKTDFNKLPFEQLFEIAVPLGDIKYYKENLKQLMDPESVAIPKGLEETGNKGIIYKERFGVTLVIGPFNAPILLLLDPAILALVAGNPIILKPANVTPTVAALFQELIPKYFASEAVSIVTGGREEITALLELPFDFIEPQWFMYSAHTGPSDAFKAFKDLKAKYWIPMHYGTFDLSDEPIYYPEKILREKYPEAVANIMWMQIGEKITLS